MRIEYSALRNVSDRRLRPSRAVLAAFLAPALAFGGLAATMSVPSTAAPAHAEVAAVNGDPVILGEVRVGRTVTADAGTWNPAPSSVLYQWLIDGDPVGAPSASPTFTPFPDDFRKTLRVTAIITRPGLPRTERTSAAYTVWAGQLTAPQFRLVGQPRRGSTVSVERIGNWTPSEGVNQNYRWYYDGKLVEPVQTYDAPTHVVRSEGAGKVLSVEVIGSKIGYDWKHVTLTSSPVETADIPFVKAPTPTIAKVQQPTGLYLSAQAGEWDPVPSLSYQWFRDGQKLDGAEFDHYRLTAADAGKRFTVKVTGELTGYIPAVRISVPLVAPGAGAGPGKPVVRRLSATPKPRISGTVRVGKKISVRAGSWKPAKVSLSYRWLRNGKAIKGATKSKYKLTRKDRGKRISVRVTGKKSGYVTVVKTSSAKRVR